MYIYIYIYICVCACVRVCVCACVRACEHICVFFNKQAPQTYTQTKIKYLISTTAQFRDL